MTTYPPLTDAQRDTLLAAFAGFTPAGGVSNVGSARH